MVERIPSQLQESEVITDSSEILIKVQDRELEDMIKAYAIDVFKKHGELVSDNCAGVVVMGREIINIDTPLDFQLAEILASEK